MEGLTVVLAPTEGVTVKVCTVEVKFRLQLAATAPDVYTDPDQEPLAQVPPTELLAV